MDKIKFFSQLDHTVPEDWQRQVCGLACVKMIIDSSQDDISITDLIKEGELIGAYDRDLNNGLWTHEGMVRILRNHGVLAYAQEFRAVDVDLDTGEFKIGYHEEELMQKGMEKIMRFVKRGKPVIGSFKAGFSENTDSHMVLIKGVKTAESKNAPIFIVNDPLVGEDIEVTLDHFLKYWKKMVIFVN